MQTIDTFLSQLCEHCGLTADQFSVSLEETEGRILVQLNVPDEDSGLFIGHHGDTLESLQRVLRIIFQKEDADPRILLNVNDYRQKREEKLRETTRLVAQRVLETGEEHTFRTYFSAHERFIIHTTLGEDPQFAELESVSAGEGKDRRLSIQFKNA